MKRLLLFITFCWFVTPVCAVVFPSIDDWNPSSEIMTFTPDTLWEQINGAAETFIQYGFQELKTAELSNVGITVAIGIYDMGTPLNAFGIYRTELPEDATTIKIGAQALISAPYQGLLVKDRFYIKVDVYEGEIDDAMARSILEAIASALPGRNGMPKVFEKLPAKGQIPGSQRFTREAFLGVRELKQCISADYADSKGGTVQFFVMLPSEGATIDSVWKSLANTWKTVPHGPEPVLAKKVPYRGFVGVIRTDQNIFGIAGSESQETLLGSLVKFSAVQ